MADRRLRTRRIGAGRQTEQPPMGRCMRSDTNSDMSDADDRYGVDVDEDNLREASPSCRATRTHHSTTFARPNIPLSSSFDSASPASGDVAQMNLTSTIPTTAPTTPPRAAPWRRRRQHCRPLLLEDEMGSFSEMTGMEGTSMSSSGNPTTDNDTRRFGIAPTNSGGQNTRSNLFGGPAYPPGSGLFGSGTRMLHNSPGLPSSHALSPRRTRGHRRMGSGSENLMPRSLSQSGPPNSLQPHVSDHRNSQALDDQVNTEDRRRSDRARDPRMNNHRDVSNAGSYLNDLSDVSWGDHWRDNIPRFTRSTSSSQRRQEPFTSHTNRESQPLIDLADPLDNWVDSDSDSGDLDDEAFQPYHYRESEDSLFSVGINPRNYTSDRLRSLSHGQTMQAMRDRVYRLSSDNNFTKRPRDKADANDGNNSDITSVLEKKGAIAALLYHSERPQAGATDVWPDIRDRSKAPSRYYHLSDKFSNGSRLKRRGLSVHDCLRPSKMVKLKLKSCQNSMTQVQGWPKERLPTEMFEEITSYLSRDDIKSMRLVSREFDKHVSQVLFRTVVVPFNTEIYGMLRQDKKPEKKGRGKVKVEVNKGLSWKNASGDDVYNGHGLDVFRGFGPHIRKYAMSFDVDEDALANPPFKGSTESHSSFWGHYEWPFEEYRRFDDVAGLELAADETPKMKTAFSMLQKVQELALSLDSGLGWLKGPDRSIWSRIIRKQPQVFGSSKDIPDRKQQAQQELWKYIEHVHRNALVDLKTSTLYRMSVNIPLKDLKPITDANAAPGISSRLPYLDPRLVAEATLDDFTVEGRTDDVADLNSLSDDDSEVLYPDFTPTSSVGILYSSSTPPSDIAQLRSSIIPTKLSKAQKEWLLETEWAQRAFLSSYMLAVMDNPTAFETVHTLNIARISSRYTSALCREDFWNALPKLKTVTIQVLPDWRNVVKDEAGFVETPRIDPQHAIEPFYQLLKEMICPRKNIKNLTIGWAAGGEHAEGIHARNKHVLPAPVLLKDATLLLQSGQIEEAMLSFPHVEHLTLRNCWITPPAMQVLVTKHEKTRLSKLTLASVSLTAMPRPLANNNANQNGNAVHLNLPNHLQAMVNVQQAQNQVQNLAAVNQQNQGGLQLHLLNHVAAITANPPAGVAPPQQLIALQIHVLQLQIAHLQNQQGAQAQAQIPNMQAQLQAHLNVQTQLQAAPAAAPAAPPGLAVPVPGAAAQPPAPITPQSAVRALPREGSWPYILDLISPGQNLSDFGSTHSNADPARTTTLQTLVLKSCGYVRLPHASIDEAGFEPIGAHNVLRHPFFAKRYSALAPAMLASKDPLMGEVVQEVVATEVAACQVAWCLTTGWGEEGEAEARGVEFDGGLKGGSGRFSGVVSAADRVATE